MRFGSATIVAGLAVEVELEGDGGAEHLVEELLHVVEPLVHVERLRVRVR